MAVAQPQLLHKEYEVAVLAISDKSRRLTGSQHNAAVFCEVHSRLSDVVVHVKAAALTGLYFEHLPRDGTRPLEQKLVLAVFELVVLAIKVFALFVP